MQLPSIYSIETISRVPSSRLFSIDKQVNYYPITTLPAPQFRNRGMRSFILSQTLVLQRELLRFQKCGRRNYFDNIVSLIFIKRKFLSSSDKDVQTFFLYLTNIPLLNEIDHSKRYRTQKHNTPKCFDQLKLGKLQHHNFL